MYWLIQIQIKIFFFPKTTKVNTVNLNLIKKNLRNCTACQVIRNALLY